MDDRTSVAKKYLEQVCVRVSTLDVVALAGVADVLRAASRKGCRVYAVGGTAAAQPSQHTSRCR